MSLPPSFCPTCLSNLEDGAKLSEALITFLCDIMHFKQDLLIESQHIICRKCFKTLIELKCFYTQLRDVEVYFQRSINSTQCLKLEEEDEEIPYIENIECNVSLTEGFKEDPIQITNNDDDCCVIEDETPPKKPKLPETPTGKRIVCLTCSKLFQSVSDLRSHEKTAHSTPILIHKASPVFLKVPKLHKCIGCDLEFSHIVQLDSHIKKCHVSKVINMKCIACKTDFTKTYKESKELCDSCQAKYKKGIPIYTSNGGKRKSYVKKTTIDLANV